MLDIYVAKNNCLTKTKSMAELKEFMKLKIRFTEFSIVFVTHSENVSSDSLAKIARSFHKKLLDFDPRLRSADIFCCPFDKI